MYAISAVKSIKLRTKYLDLDIIVVDMPINKSKQATMTIYNKITNNTCLKQNKQYILSIVEGIHLSSK